MNVRPDNSYQDHYYVNPTILEVLRDDENLDFVPGYSVPLVNISLEKMVRSIVKLSAVGICPHGHPDKLSRLNLGSSLFESLLRDLSDMTKSVSVLEEASTTDS